MRLSTADTYVIVLFFLIMLIVGVYAFFKNKNSSDYFIAGGNLPWWLSGISHHISGYSGAVFVAYAALAYTHGFSVYVWWAFTIGASIIVSSKLFPTIWVRLRVEMKIQSPLEYLKIRYNLATQQIMAWCGVLLKLFDVGAKWAAIAVLLNVFTGMSTTMGILIAGGISLVYITFGGFWAVILTDFSQFIIQLAAGVVMFCVVVMQMGGFNSIWSMWQKLPPENSKPFTEPYTLVFAIVFLLINFLSYNGGTWNLASKYISTKNESQASKAAVLSGILYLIWPLILFFPMWAAPLILPNLHDPTQSYGLLTLKLLPSGLVGLVVASLFAHTMAMTSSDVNTISAVITRDILPVIYGKSKKDDITNSLVVARSATFIFMILTILVALQYKHFGGIFGLIVMWFGALLGPIAVPMLLGLLYPFRRSGSGVAIFSIVAGFVAFVISKNIHLESMAMEVSLPLTVSLATYIIGGLLNYNKRIPEKVEFFLRSLSANRVN
jgi:solute:Na+ symporter, SSS family